MRSFKGISGLLALTLSTFIASISFAEGPKTFSAFEKDFLTIDKISLTETSSTSPVAIPCYVNIKNCPTTTPQPKIDNPIGSIGNIIYIGEQLWKIVEAGKPSAHIVSNSVSALPKENPDWTQMSYWQGPLIKSYHLEAVNNLGFKVVSMDYKVMGYYGGKWKDKGQYLLNLTVITDNASVAWGYDLRATAELQDLVNTADENNPVPGCTLQMKWRIDSFFKHDEGSHSIFVKGDGTLRDL